MLLCGVGHEIPIDAPEQLCPECLSSLPAPTSTLSPIGPFQLLDLLGEGGFGRVYRARRAGQSETVALKVLRNLELADSAAVAAFRREPTLSSKLKPEYVVRVLEVGEHAGLPYFTMEYMVGGTLRARIKEYRQPEQAAQLMIQIAEAVQYFHRDPERPEREPILHRDLKPENILFDAQGQPRISDFGIAKLAKMPDPRDWHEAAAWTLGTRAMGCPAYMAPEQVYPTARRELTAAADVYALGAIFYELLTGRPPFDGKDLQILYQLKEEEPVPPRRLAPNLDRFLETVVLNALEKDPARRYRSAAGFAQDLKRALKQEPPQEAPPVPPSARLRTWIKRHPLTSAACLWLASLLAVVGVSVRTTLAARTQVLERDQQTNASVAGMQAVAVNLQLREYKHRIAELAQDPEVIRLLGAASVADPSRALQDRVAPFDTLFVLAPDGRQRARTSFKSLQYLARSFDFRDYFKGARQLSSQACAASTATGSAAGARTAYVARAYTSESDGRFEFAISAPLCSEQKWLGILAGTIATDKVFGAVRLLDDHHGRITGVLGPRDRERTEANLPLPNDFTFIVHPGLVQGQAVRLLHPEPAAIRSALGITVNSDPNANTGSLRYAPPLRIDRYRDPVPGFDGEWSAVIAAADESGYLVAVQSRRDVTPLGDVLLEKLALPAGLPLLVGLLCLAFFGLTRRRAWPSALSGG